MAVTHAPAGFTGTVDQIDEARRFAFGGGGRFKAASSADWAPTASGSVNRTVNIAAGAGVACGVYDATTAIDSVTVATNGGGSNRYDAVVATYDWSALTVSFRVVQGTTVPPTIVKTGTVVDATKINWLPGLRYDAVVAIVLVRPGVTLIAPADVYDCRPYGQWGRLSVASTSFRDQIDVDTGGTLKDVSTGAVVEWNGTSWQPMSALTFGKMWRTGGFSGSMTTGAGNYTVATDTARVSGGVTFSSGTSALTLPYDGLWAYVARGYVTGGPTPAVGGFYIVRKRASVADVTIGSQGIYKFDGSDVAQSWADTVPLKAGDQIVFQAQTSQTGTNYWGVSETQGVMLSLTWVAPLNGATAL